MEWYRYPGVPVAEPLDLNSASEEQLAKVPGIGQGRARTIITHRRTHGYFKGVEDLVGLEGFDNELVDQIREALTA